jgi:DNA-binding response OmpR family regulator
VSPDAQPHEAPSRDKLVLIGEDDDAIADALAMAISDQPGYDAVIMSGGSFVLETAQRVRPDALILDILLPGMSGFAVYDQLRGDPRTEHLPIIFISAMARAFTAEIAGRGITDVFSKPFELDAVLGRLWELCPPPAAEASPAGTEAPSPRSW